MAIRADQKADDLRPAEAELADRLNFITPVAEDGYVWWYVDGMSDDGAHGLSIIAFIGSVFSPYYARARRRGGGDPENFIALNVALYGRGGKRWCMTERGRTGLARDSTSLHIGPSSLRLEGDELVIRIDETTVPWLRALKGEVRVRPAALTTRTCDLDAEGRHRWSPIAPQCRLEVAMEAPSRRWSGDGYLDRNQGTRPLEDDFSCWDWSRARLGDNTVILYDVKRRDASRLSIGLNVDRQGRALDIEPPPRHPLPANRWQVPRSSQYGCDAEAGHNMQTGREAHPRCGPQILKTLEDTPFYSRSVIATHLMGKPATAMHESLSLDRFRRRWVQMLLPFRMPRRG